MSNEFVATKARAFKQSPCRARVTRQPGFFGFQILNTWRQACDSNTAPLGWPSGIYDGANGPYVAWQDFSLEDPRDATFITPTAPQLKTDGWLQEDWLSELPLIDGFHSDGFPTPVFFRDGLFDHARLHKSGSPLGIFNSETIGSGFKVRRAAMLLAQGFTYSDVTSSFGVFFPAGVLQDQFQWISIYDTIGGTLTKHTVPRSLRFILASQFTGTLPPPHHVEEYFPSKGDPPRVFKPDNFVYANADYNHPPFYVPTITPGTMEILMFWFYLRIADLPSFPLAFNTATDFIFVG